MSFQKLKNYFPKQHAHDLFEAKKQVTETEEQLSVINNKFTATEQQLTESKKQLTETKEELAAIKKGMTSYILKIVNLVQK